MNSLLLLAVALISVTLTGCSPQGKSEAPAREAQYRPLDPASDGFTVELTSDADLRWNSDGWLSGGPVNLTATGTAAAIKGAKVVLLESGKCAGGNLETKDYGIIKIRMVGGITGNYFMTQESIAKIRHALDKKAWHFESNG
jgi:hypothetical protein